MIKLLNIDQLIKSRWLFFLRYVRGTGFNVVLVLDSQCKWQWQPLPFRESCGCRKSEFQCVLLDGSTEGHPGRQTSYWNHVFNNQGGNWGNQLTQVFLKKRPPKWRVCVCVRAHARICLCVLQEATLNVAEQFWMYWCITKPDASLSRVHIKAQQSPLFQLTPIQNQTHSCVTVIPQNCY